MLIKSARTVSREFSLEIRVYFGLASKGVRKGGLWLTPPIEFDMLQKLYYLRKRD